MQPSENNPSSVCLNGLQRTVATKANVDAVPLAISTAIRSGNASNADVSGRGRHRGCALSASAQVAETGTQAVTRSNFRPRCSTPQHGPVPPGSGSRVENRVAVRVQCFTHGLLHVADQIGVVAGVGVRKPSSSNMRQWRLVSVPTIVGVGSPVVLVLVPLVVDVLGIIVCQGLQVSAPLVGVEDAVDDTAAACSLCRIRRGVAVPRRHAPIPVGPARHRSGFENPVPVGGGGACSRTTVSVVMTCVLLM